jgi:shikimate kinase
LLQTDNPRGKLADLMAEREPLYREIADIVIETDGKRVQSVVRQICDYLEG